MNEEHLRQVLRDLAQEGIPDDMNRWEAIRAKASDVNETMVTGRVVRRRVWRAGRIGVLVALLLLASMGAFAVFQQNERGLEGAEQAGLLTQVGQTQRIDDVQITLNWAYADGNHIALNVQTEVIGEGDRVWGANFPERYTLRLREKSGLIVFENPTSGEYNTSGQPETLYFNLPQGLALPAALNLALEVVFNQPPPVKTIFSRHGSRSSTGGGIIRTLPESTAEVLPLPVPEDGVGQFAFDFSVPVQRSITVEVMEVVEAASIPITLEYVSVAPTDTRAYVCYPLQEPLGITGQWRMQGEIAMGQIVEKLWLGSGGSFPRLMRYCQEFRLDVFLPEMPEGMVITISAFESFQYDNYDVEALNNLLAEDGMKAVLDVEHRADGSTSVGYRLEGGDWESEAYKAALVEMGYRIEGPWVFTVDLR